MTSRFPYPLEKGDKLRLYYQLLHLHQSHKIKLIAICESELTAEQIAMSKTFCSELEVHILPKFKRYLQAINALSHGIPAQVGYFYNKKIKKSIQQSIIAFQPDRIYCQLIRAAEYVKSMPFPKVLDYMDCLSLGMKNQQNVNSGLKALFYKVETKYVQQYEKQIFSFFDECVIIAKKDRDQLPLLSKEQVHIIPNGIDVEKFKPKSTDIKKYDVIFVGNLGYKPNEQAVLLFHNWYVKSYGLNDGPTVAIYGARPTELIQNIKHPQWNIVGWVDDIRAAYASGKVFIAPLFTGSGLQNKILEAMSMQLPCITTPIVNDAINAAEDKEIVVADNESAFIEKLNFLLKNEQVGTDIGKNAAKFVEHKFNWSTFNQSLEQIIVNSKAK